MGGQRGARGWHYPSNTMKSLLVILGVLLAATGASPLTFHTGYSQSAWVAEKAPKLVYGNRAQSRSGHVVGVSHVLPHRWADVRLGIASVARGTRSIPGTVRSTLDDVHISAIELSVLGELDLPVSYVLLAGPYIDLRFSCCGVCPDRRINGGIKYGIGIRTTYRKTKIPLSLDIIREQGLRATYGPRSHGIDSHHKGFLIQIGIR